MRNPLSRGLVVGFVTIMLGIGYLFVAYASSTADTPDTFALQTIGQPRADAVPLKVWTDKESGQVFREGERAIISFQAERAAYLAMLAVSSDGSVHILFPNNEIPNNLIQQGKVYTLFGDDSSLRLTAGQKFKDWGLVFYLSPKPFSLDPLKAAGDQLYISIPVGASDKINTLKDKLKAISQEPGFNRIVLPLAGGGGENLEAKLSILQGQAKDPSRKALPGGVESSKPLGVTGTPGLKPLREEGSQR